MADIPGHFEIKLTPITDKPDQKPSMRHESQIKQTFMSINNIPSWKIKQAVLKESTVGYIRNMDDE